MLKNNLIRLILPSIELLGYEFIGIEFLKSKTSILRIYINHKNGININDCANISRHISTILDNNCLINTDYILEVSSPGINNQNLYNIKNYSHFIGYEIKLVLKNPIQNWSTCQGIINYVTDKKINIIIGYNKKSFALNNIKQANLVPHFKNID